MNRWSRTYHFTEMTPWMTLTNPHVAFNLRLSPICVEVFTCYTNCRLDAWFETGSFAWVCLVFRKRVRVQNHTLWFMYYWMQNLIICWMIYKPLGMILNTHTKLLDVNSCEKHTKNSTQHKSCDSRQSATFTSTTLIPSSPTWSRIRQLRKERLGWNQKVKTRIAEINKAK